MIGRTNAGFGGGINLKNPLIHVNAPIGSTVNFSINNIIIKSISPTRAIPNADNKTADYYYSGKFGIYTVVITHPDFETTKTVEVNTNKEYNIILPTRLYLYYKGDMITDLTGDYSKVASGTFANTIEEYMYFSSGAATVRYAASNNAINIYPYNKLIASGCTLSTTEHPDNFSIGLSTERGDSFIVFAPLPNNTSTFGEVEIDISSLSTDVEYYIQFSNGSSSNSGGQTRIQYIYLEF